MAKKGGLISRLIMGSEKSEEYARASLPSNRWELFWDIFKGRFWKIVIVNLLILLFFLPLFALLFFRNAFISSMTVYCPFSSPFGAGYQALPSLAGYHEGIVANVDMTVFMFLPIALAIAGVGLAGGAYVIRNMVWTEGIFVANDFWRGVKQNFVDILLTSLLYSVIFYAVQLSVGVCNRMLAVGAGTAWLLNVSVVMSYVAMAFVTMIYFHAITMSVTYKLKFGALLKNSFLLTLGLLPQNVFFIAIAGIPVILCLLGGIFLAIGVIMTALIGLAYALLVWTDYSQWVYDKFINDRVAGAQKNRGIYEKVGKGDKGESEAVRRYREQVAMASKSTYSGRPIKPITDDELTIAELPQSFTREDIAKLNESKQALYDDFKNYVEEHKNDAEYQKTEADLEAEKLAREKEKRIADAKAKLEKHARRKK